MAIKLADTLAPMADFPAALAEHVEFSDGKSLQEKYDLGELGGEGGGGEQESVPESAPESKPESTPESVTESKPSQESKPKKGCGSSATGVGLSLLILPAIAIIRKRKD